MIQLRLYSIFALICSYCVAFAQDKPYIESIEECYNQLEFKNDKYRIKYEGQCYTGLKVPAMEIELLDSTVIDSNVLKKNITVLNFWFTSCPPCIAEMPGLKEVAYNFRNYNVKFIAAATDSPEEIDRFLSRRGSFGFDLAPNSASLFYETLNIKSGFPTTIILDQDGVIRYFFAGGYVDFRASRRIKKKITKALNNLLDK